MKNILGGQAPALSNCSITEQNGKLYLSFRKEPTDTTKSALYTYGYQRLNKPGNLYVADAGSSRSVFLTKLLCGAAVTEEYLYGRRISKGGVQL